MKLKENIFIYRLRTAGLKQLEQVKHQVERGFRDAEQKSAGNFKVLYTYFHEHYVYVLVWEDDKKSHRLVGNICKNEHGLGHLCSESNNSRLFFWKQEEITPAILKYFARNAPEFYQIVQSNMMKDQKLS